jgi:hypothetical protein
MAMPVAILVALTVGVTAGPAGALFADTTTATGNSVTAASSWGLRFYLHNNPTPPVGDTTSQSILPMDRTAPTATTLYNYDTDRDTAPGLITLAGSTYQYWAYVAPEVMVLNDTVSLRMWSAVQGFSTTAGGQVDSYLYDCTPGWTTCTLISSGSYAAKIWDAGGTGTWVDTTIPMTGVAHKVATGNELVLIAWAPATSPSNMMFAYDTTSHRSWLQVGS